MKEIYLVTNSSLSNTIANTLWLKRNKSEKNIFIVLNFQKYNKKEICYLNKIYRKNISKDYYYLVNISSNLKKLTHFFSLFLFISIYKIYYFIFKNKYFKLTIIQPRYRWLSERFSFLGQFIPSFDTILIGDGLSGECLVNTPPWANIKNVFYSRLGVEKLINSYYLYSIYGNKYNKNKSTRFTRYELEDCIKDIDKILSLENKFKETYRKIKKINRDYRKIFIFMASTFWEYQRLSLDSEIELYTISLNLLLEKYNFDSSKDFIIFKFHPATNNHKITRFKQEIRNSINSFCSSDLFLENLLIEFPLELLLLNFKNKNEIIINGISTGIVPSSYIYKNLIIELGFGEKLVKKFFKTKELIDKRLKQEDLISKLIKDHPN